MTQKRINPYAQWRYNANASDVSSYARMGCEVHATVTDCGGALWSCKTCGHNACEKYVLSGKACPHCLTEVQP